MEENKKSTHKCEVVPVVLEPHPNADSLSIVKVFGYQVCVKTETWQGISLGAYIVPDSIVDISRPEFAFLSSSSDNKGKSHVRIRAKRLRGENSYGMLVPAPDGSKEGDDVAELLGVERYNPPEINLRGSAQGYVSLKAQPVPPPDVPFSIPVYDVDAFQRYAKNVFVPGEMVYVSEKIDGANTRFLWDGNRMHIGSRNRWLEEEGTSAWHKVLERRPEIRDLCIAHENCILWGETYGFVQDLHYGMDKGVVDFIAFDIMRNGRWMDILDVVGICNSFCVPIAPQLGVVPYDFNELMKMAEGPSLIEKATHYREGCVVRPLQERWDNKIGRAQLKIISMDYLENAGREKPYKVR